MADHTDLIPANLKPGLTTPDGQDLKPSLVTPLYTGGTPTAVEQIKPSLRDSAGNLKPGLLDGDMLKRSLVSAFGTIEPETFYAPAIAGLPEEGETLTVSTGAYSQVPATVTYQWYADGIAISNATEATLVVQTGDLGKTVSVEESAVFGLTTIVTLSAGRKIRTAHLAGITIGSYLIGA
ncbi:MAG: hypothetical protein Aurels2KO_25490 [Aureliella sp.]